MGRLRYSRDARQDLLDLWIHIALENPGAADRLIDRIEEACGKLRDYPRIGVARPDIGDHARVLIVDRWMAIYRLVPGGAQIVRIVDGSRDLLRFPWKSPDIE